MEGNPFDVFWGMYPRREAKLAAMKAFDKALGLASAQIILEGVGRYVAWINTTGRDRQFVKLPATWLNQGCWEDELLPPKPKQPQKAARFAPQFEWIKGPNGYRQIAKTEPGGGVN